MNDGLTVEQLWRWLTDGDVSDAVLEWAPDVGALTSVLLERSHAFRFVVSPPQDCTWPPVDAFSALARSTADAWRRAMDSGDPPPEAVRDYWSTVMAHLQTPISQVSQGTPWELCEAVLALHAIADEACAGCSGGAATGPGFIFRAKARELLARTGSMARLPVDRVSQLPKCRTTSVGITHRSLSRYSCTSTSGIKVVWDRIPMRRPDRPVTRHANILLLPWPLRIRESDFIAVPGSVRRPEREPFGFFTYEPSEGLDLGLVDRLLDAALEEVDGVDVVVLPEGCLNVEQVAALEELLGRRGVTMLVTGVRPEPSAPGLPPNNAVHSGLFLGGRWWHYRQNKHHRWFLDASQIETYNIAGALHPSVRWWEAMDVPERSVHFLELGGGITVAAVVCEDLARLDGVADLLRSVGPSLVLTLLLDGPQLAARWTARYAGVLADDPGSAVLTLTALGMTLRSQPRGMPPSRVIAMWKDPSRGLREITLEPGAQGVLLKAVLDRSARYAADGREPMDDVTDFYIAGVQQLRAGGDGADPGPPVTPVAAVLDAAELSVLSAWTQAAADAVASSDVQRVLEAAQPQAEWRGAAGLPPPEGSLATALLALASIVRMTDGDSVRAMRHRLASTPIADDIDSVVRVSLIAALEAIPAHAGP